MEGSKNEVTFLDRRRKPRIDCQYMAIVHGCGPHGSKFEESATLANLSSTGLFMFVNYPFKLGEKVFVIVRINTDLLKETTPRIAIDGIVTRTEPQADGLTGVAIDIQRYKFL